MSLDQPAGGRSRLGPQRTIKTVPRTYMSAAGVQSEIATGTLASVARHQAAYIRQVDTLRHKLELRIREIHRDEVLLHKSIAVYAQRLQEEQHELRREALRRKVVRSNSALRRMKVVSAKIKASKRVQFQSPDGYREIESPLSIELLDPIYTNQVSYTPTREYRAPSDKANKKQKKVRLLGETVVSDPLKDRPESKGSTFRSQLPADIMMVEASAITCNPRPMEKSVDRAYTIPKNLHETSRGRETHRDKMEVSKPSKSSDSSSIANPKDKQRSQTEEQNRTTNNYVRKLSILKNSEDKQKVAIRPAEKPVEKPAEKPAGKPDETPADKPASLASDKENKPEKVNTPDPDSKQRSSRKESLSVTLPSINPQVTDPTDPSNDSKVSVQTKPSKRKVARQEEPALVLPKLIQSSTVPTVTKPKLPGRKTKSLVEYRDSPSDSPNRRKSVGTMPTEEKKSGPWAPRYSPVKEAFTEDRTPSFEHNVSPLTAVSRYSSPDRTMPVNTSDTSSSPKPKGNDVIGHMTHADISRRLGKEKEEVKQAQAHMRWVHVMAKVRECHHLKTDEE